MKCPQSRRVEQADDQSNTCDRADDAPRMIAHIGVRVAGIFADATLHATVVKVVESLLHGFLGAGSRFLNAIVGNIGSGTQ